eukprot:TRINITY_DN428_c0_g1_i1.p1 TRINITY_DN428_c0_g1~~TRINITY_DN428_c0_g1_i1.p1  ORF type:complete len:183 (-),score=29.21 TRINITY_DN428_c0_g1_i1:88-636(-)
MSSSMSVLTPALEEWLVDLFSSENQPIEHLVLLARERLGSVAELLKWLTSYLGKLDGEIHELVQAKYKSFLALHERNENSEDIIDGLQTPLRNIKKQVEASVEVLQSEAVKVNCRLEEATELENKKRFLHTLIEMNSLLQKVGSLFVHIDREYSSLLGKLPPPSLCSRYERVANCLAVCEKS